MNLFTKQKYTDIEQTYVYQKENMGEGRVNQEFGINTHSYI